MSARVTGTVTVRNPSSAGLLDDLEARRDGGFALRLILPRSLHCSVGSSFKPVQALRYATEAWNSRGVKSGVIRDSPLCGEIISTGSMANGSAQYILNIVTIIWLTISTLVL